MNDLEEVRFGIIRGAEKIRTNKQLANALETDERRSRFQAAFEHYFALFADEHSLDGASGGAPRGNSNARKHGLYTAAAIRRRQVVAELIRSSRELVETL